MYYEGLSQLADAGNVDRDVVVKFDKWLGSMPSGFKGALRPETFADRFDVDCSLAAELFNEACMKKILKICFVQICPKCGKCLETICPHSCTKKCGCEDKAASPRTVRFSYHLNEKVMAN
jgi:hypothetical protein